VANVIEKLANAISDDPDRYNLDIEDQYGNKVQLPESERKNLIIGMTLYEKGKASMKKGNHKEALEFLTRADEAFSNCHSQYLNLVDNYGYLNIDIAWSYLQIKDVQFLQDAKWRLQKAQELLKKKSWTKYGKINCFKRSLCPRTSILCSFVYITWCG